MKNIKTRKTHLAKRPLTRILVIWFIQTVALIIMALLMKSVYIQSIGEALLVTAVYALASGNLGLVSFTKFPERLTLEKNAHLNVISHLLSLIPYEDLTPEHLELPPRQEAGDYQHPDISQFNIVPTVYP